MVGMEAAIAGDEKPIPLSPSGASAAIRKLMTPRELKQDLVADPGVPAVIEMKLTAR